MLGLKGKITLAVISIMLLSTSAIVFISYSNSSAELTAAVEKGNMDLVHATASDISAINENVFQMLESVANLSIVRDPDVDMYEKWKLANSATGGQAKYYGTAFLTKKESVMQQPENGATCTHANILKFP